MDAASITIIVIGLGIVAAMFTHHLACIARHKRADELAASRRNAALEESQPPPDEDSNND